MTGHVWSFNQSEMQKLHQDVWIKIHELLSQVHNPDRLWKGGPKYRPTGGHDFLPWQNWGGYKNKFIKVGGHSFLKVLMQKNLKKKKKNMIHVP